MKAQTWWKGSKTFRIRNERSWFYYFVIFLFIKKKKQFHHNFASQLSFNSSFPFRLKIMLNVEKNSFQAINGIIFNLALTFLYQTISCHNHPPPPSILPPIFHQNYKIWTNKILNRKRSIISCSAILKRQPSKRNKHVSVSLQHRLQFSPRN